MRSALALVMLGLVALFGCSDNSDPPPKSDATITGDAKTGGDASAGLSLQTVMSKMLMPSNAGAHALDLDGNGVKDNHVGRILAALAAANSSLDLQAQLDTQMQNGELLLLNELTAPSLKQTDKATLRAFFGKDLDTNAANNFTGSGAFGIGAISPTNAVLHGKITGGQLIAGPGNLAIPIPLGKIYVVLSAKLVQVHATVTDKGLTSGILAAAIPISEMSTTMIPALANEMHRQYNDPNVTPTGKKMLEKTFDLDKDGSITADELRKNPIIGLMLDSADVDTDGDKIPDAMSVGLGFEAVTCTIDKTR